MSETAKTAAKIHGSIAALAADRDTWKSHAEMFATTWRRELGPHRTKTHLIDELVCGTRDLRTQHDELVTENLALKAEIRRLSKTPLWDWYEEPVRVEVGR